MAFTPQHGSASSHQAWKLIEQDYTLRLQIISGEWAEAHLKAWNGVFSEGRRRNNAGYFGPALVEMEIEDVDKRAEWAYKTCCEIWDIQGRTKGRPFFRAVFDWCIQPMLSVREGCFEHQLKIQGVRTNKPDPQDQSVIIGAMKREMVHLRAKWNTKLEIATRDTENRQRLARERDSHAVNDLRMESFYASENHRSATLTAEPFGAIGSDFTWKELEIRFRHLQARTTPTQAVRAERTRTEWESGSVDEEWALRVNAALRSEYVGLASIAARKLGYAPAETAYKDWLGRVWKWMQEVGLDKDTSVGWCPTGSGSHDGATYTTKHLFTERIAELSAKFCLSLIAHHTPESVVSHPSGQSATVPNTFPKNGTSKKAGRPATRNPEFQVFASECWKEESARAKSEGRKRVDMDGLKRIAAHLDDRHFRKPSEYLEEKAARELKVHNKKFANSPANKIMSWSALVEASDPDHLAAMRKLLSRCSCNIRK